MDVEQALYDLLTAVKNADRDTAHELVDDLVDWTERDGYWPLVHVAGVAV